MADLKAFTMGANVVTSYKNKKFCAMTCAWAMMCDYDKLMMLLGNQSDTGRQIKKGDIIGVSALSKGQATIAKHFGDNHSLSFPKFNQHYLEKKGDTYVVKGAKTKMICEVLDVLHLPGIEKDNLLYLLVIKADVDEKKEFLDAKDLSEE